MLTELINEGAGHHPVFDHIMSWLSIFGVPIMVASVALQWWGGVGVGQTRRRHAIVSAGLSFLVGLGLNQLVLLFIDRIRPYDAGISHLIVARSADSSFPSDHATAAFAIAFAYLFCGKSRDGLVYVMAAFLIALSRVYLGTHYVSDVAGGVLTAFAAAAAVCLSYRQGTSLDRRLTAIF
jgi:undecaprenyl-diphosphatase